MTFRSAVVQRRSRVGRGVPAFTLIELCVGLFVGGILCIGMMTLFKTASSAFRKTGEQLESLQTAQMVAESIREDLQTAVL